MSLAEIWSYDFLRYAILSSCILGPTCALLGVFVTLRGMAFFSDALAHSAVTGVALGFLVNEKLGLDIDPMLVVLVFSVLLATLMAWLFQRTNLSPDTVIAFSFTGSVAFGVVVIAWLEKYRLLDGILFGSIYSNGPADIVKQSILALLVGVFLLGQMRRYTLATLSPELARARGIGTAWLNYSFALLIAATVVVALKMLGALLLSALIVIPSAGAKLVSHSFRGMLVFAVLAGLAAPLAGVLISCQINVPTGPTIVLANVTILVGCYLFRALRPAS
ncbi:MAG: metal ABC transporter permease [Terrimicrobiaceae bacterium]